MYHLFSPHICCCLIVPIPFAAMGVPGDWGPCLPTRIVLGWVASTLSSGAHWSCMHCSYSIVLAHPLTWGEGLMGAGVLTTALAGATVLTSITSIVNWDAVQGLYLLVTVICLYACLLMCLRPHSVAFLRDPDSKVASQTSLCTYGQPTKWNSKPLAFKATETFLLACCSPSHLVGQWTSLLK